MYVYCVKTLGLPIEKVNVNGGAIALGHPLDKSHISILNISDDHPYLLLIWPRYAAPAPDRLRLVSPSLSGGKVRSSLRACVWGPGWVPPLSLSGSSRTLMCKILG